MFLAAARKKYIYSLVFAYVLSHEEEKAMKPMYWAVVYWNRNVNGFRLASVGFGWASRLFQAHYESSSLNRCRRRHHRPFLRPRPSSLHSRYGRHVTVLIVFSLAHGLWTSLSDTTVRVIIAVARLRSIVTLVQEVERTLNHRRCHHFVSPLSLSSSSSPISSLHFRCHHRRPFRIPLVDHHHSHCPLPNLVLIVIIIIIIVALFGYHSSSSSSSSSLCVWLIVCAIWLRHIMLQLMGVCVWWISLSARNW